MATGGKPTAQLGLKSMPRIVVNKDSLRHSRPPLGPSSSRFGDRQSRFNQNELP
jgi:hypothetical protein